MDPRRHGRRPDLIDPPPLLARAPRAATAVFGASVVVAAAARLRWRRDQWFFQDEWAALAGHELSVDGLLAAHSGHWFTIPRLAYLLLFQLVGLRSYLPYFALALGAHVAAAVVVWATARRVAPVWLAAAAGAALALGTALMTVVSWYFLLTVALGLGQVLLADRDGPPDRRDALGLLCGLAALMTTGVGVVLVAAAATVALLRRGWRAAALHGVPLAVVYLAWSLVHGGATSSETAAPSTLASFAVRLVAHGLTELGGGAVVGVLLAALAGLGAGRSVVGVVRGLRDDRRVPGPVALPAVLTLATVAFALLTAYGRAGRFGVDFATRPRYALVVIALLLPVVAAGAALVVERVRWAAVPVVVLVLAGVPAGFRSPPIERQPGVDADALLAWGAPDGPAADVDPDLLVFPGETGAGAVTVGWAQDLVASGRIEGEPSAAATARVADRVLVHVDGRRPVPSDCEPLEEMTPVELAAGEGVGVRGVVFYSGRAADGSATPVMGVDAGDGTVLVASRGPSVVSVGPAPNGGPAEVCR